MKEHRLSVFKLCAQDHIVMSIVFIVLCTVMSVSIKRLLLPYFNNDVVLSSYESVKRAEPKIVTEILANRYGEASRIVEREILQHADATKYLNLFNLQEYDSYGLSHNCHANLSLYEWGIVCIDGKTYSIEVPIKSADNTLAHVSIRLRRNISEWTPYRLTKYCLWSVIVISIGITIVSLKRVHRKIISPLGEAVKSIEEANDYQDFDPILSQIPIKELHRVTSRLFQKQKLLNQIQLENSELQAISKMASLASRVAHDIRSPLSSMQAAARLLKEHVTGNKDAIEAVNLLQLSGNRLECISNDLLARNKDNDSSGSAVFSIHEVLDELIGELRASPIGQGTEFVKHYHSNALYVSGDKTGVSRAIGNIIKNALEAMGNNPAERTKQLTVSTTLNSPSPQPSPTGEGIIVRITDTGPGIPADKIPLILQGGHTEGKEDGHGIGTKVVREVIDAHKGELKIESDVGKGTSFIITLPMADIATQASDLTVTIPYSSSTPICVIDDEPSMREQWRLTLKALGADVETYTCWENVESASYPGRGAGVQSESQSGCRLEGRHDDVFIVDYHFDNSEVDGIEIIRRLKERGHSQFVLATAEYWKPAIKDAAKELNITLCPKPLPKVVLQETPPRRKVPEGVEASTSPDPSLQRRGENVGPSVLLIDDDEAIRMTWKAVKRILGVDKLTMYSNLEEMIAAATNPADYDMCVIDKNIQGSQYNGATMLAHLKENGAKKVFLATGETRRQIEQDPAFAAIDGIITEKIPMSLEKYLN